MSTNLPDTWTAVSADDGKNWSVPTKPSTLLAGTRHNANGSATVHAYGWNSAMAAVRLPCGVTCVAVIHSRIATAPSNFWNGPADSGARNSLVVTDYQNIGGAAPEGGDIIYSGRRYSA